MLPAASAEPFMGRRQIKVAHPPFVYYFFRSDSINVTLELSKLRIVSYALATERMR